MVFIEALITISLILLIIIYHPQLQIQSAFAKKSYINYFHCRRDIQEFQGISRKFKSFKKFQTTPKDNERF